LLPGIATRFLPYTDLGLYRDFAGGLPHTGSTLNIRTTALIAFSLSASAAWGGAPTPLAVAAVSILGANQGVYVEAADGTVLLSQAAESPVHPASVSKIATTLALLHKYGIEHRFTTVFATTGRISNGTLEGDLIVEPDGDPYFVDENALLVAGRLRQAGVQRVSGTLRTRGALTFDWDIDPDGVRLRRALSGGVPAAAWNSVQGLDSVAALAAMPAIQFENSTAAMPPGTERKLVIHRSQPLLLLTKQLNDYSNNIFKPLADAAGGAPAVEALARAAVPAIMQAEIILGDGAGTDPSNRLSPRAAVALLRVLERELQSSGHALCDILPVAGIDEGTLRKRIDGPGEAGHVVGKTGTFGDYGASALIGAISTDERGTVYFAVLDHDVPVTIARQRQDRFVRALLAQFHTRPWNYQPDLRPAVARATAEIVVP
jgi:serine-type D-Ala-D-Ala carboxypeptidase/endopeptidase (penicillin-binding protein 4)